MRTLQLKAEELLLPLTARAAGKLLLAGLLASVCMLAAPRLHADPRNREPLGLGGSGTVPPVPPSFYGALPTVRDGGFQSPGTKVRNDFFVVLTTGGGVAGPLALPAAVNTSPERAGMSSAEVAGGGGGVLGEGQEATVHAGTSRVDVSETGAAGGSESEPIDAGRHLEHQPIPPPPPAATSASPLSVWT